MLCVYIDQDNNLKLLEIFTQIGYERGYKSANALHTQINENKTIFINYLVIAYLQYNNGILLDAQNSQYLSPLQMRLGDSLYCTDTETQLCFY